jgi:hypothetical protein
MTTINVPPLGHGHFFRFLENLFAPDRPKQSHAEDPVSFDEFLDRMVSLRRSGGIPNTGQRRRLERMKSKARSRFEKNGDLEGLILVREALGRPVSEAELRSLQNERGEQVRSEALDKLHSWHSTVTRAARVGSIDEHCARIPEEVDALLKQARAENIELQAMVHELAGSIHTKARAWRKTPKPRGLQDSLRSNLTWAVGLLRLGNPYQAGSVLRALERIDSDLARAEQIELDPDVARQVARLDEYRAAARAMLEYAGSFDDDLEGDVEWRTWIAADD